MDGDTLTRAKDELIERFEEFLSTPWLAKLEDHSAQCSDLDCARCECADEIEMLRADLRELRGLELTVRTLEAARKQETSRR